MGARYAAIAAILEAGFNVIADEVIWSRTWLIDAITTLQAFQVYFVGVFVSPEEADLRHPLRAVMVPDGIAAPPASLIVTPTTICKSTRPRNHRTIAHWKSGRCWMGIRSQLRSRKCVNPSPDTCMLGWAVRSRESNSHAPSPHDSVRSHSVVSARFHCRGKPYRRSHQASRGRDALRTWNN